MSPRKPVAEVLYNISGYMVSSLLKAVALKRTQWPDLFETFVTVHSISPHDATLRSLPAGIVRNTSRGKLIYASSEVYELTLRIEHAYSECLTMPNVIAFGPKLLSKVHGLALESQPIREAFEECMLLVHEQTANAQVSFIDSTPLLQHFLRMYVRMRGKDFVRILLSELKLKQAAPVTSSTRGKLAAAASKAASLIGKAASRSVQVVPEVLGVEASPDGDELDELDELSACAEIMAELCEDAIDEDEMQSSNETPCLEFDLK